MAKKKKPSTEKDDESSILELTQAVGGLVAGITAAVAATATFVQALSPSTMMVLGQAFRDLEATIGQAFLPIFVELANTFRQAAAIISPIAQALAPVFQQLAEIVGGNLLAALQVFADLLDALRPLFDVFVQLEKIGSAITQGLLSVVKILIAILSPIIQLVASVLLPVVEVVAAAFQGLADIIETIAIVIKAFTDVFVEAIKAWLADLLGTGDIIRDLKTAVQAVIIEIVRFAATLAILAGWPKVVDNLIRAFSPKAGGATAAPSGTGLKSFQQIADDLAQSAFIATSGGKSKDEEDKEFKANIVKLLTEIRDKKGEGPAGSGLAHDVVDTISDIRRVKTVGKAVLSVASFGLLG